MTLPRITIACPVRNRAWILPRYLDALDALEYPKDRLQFHFVVNDCTDNSLELLMRWMDGRRGHVDIIDIGARPSDTRGALRTGERIAIYPLLAKLRNHILDTAMEDGAHYLFSVDSDILVDPDTLLRLLSAGRDVAAGIVKNGPGHCYNFLQFSPETDQYVRTNTAPSSGIFEVGLTGACCLYSRAAMHASRFAPYGAGGEDEGMARGLRSAGITQWVDGGAHCEHIMDGPGA